LCWGGPHAGWHGVARLGAYLCVPHKGLSGERPSYKNLFRLPPPR